jgi:hypothetical protein
MLNEYTALTHAEPVASIHERDSRDPIRPLSRPRWESIFSSRESKLLGGASAARVLSRKFVAFLFRRPGLLVLSETCPEPAEGAEGQPRRKLLEIKGALAPEAAAAFGVHLQDLTRARSLASSPPCARRITRKRVRPVAPNFRGHRCFLVCLPSARAPRLARRDTCDTIPGKSHQNDVRRQIPWESSTKD